MTEGFASGTPRRCRSSRGGAPAPRRSRPGGKLPSESMSITWRATTMSDRDHVRERHLQGGVKLPPDRRAAYLEEACGVRRGAAPTRSNRSCPPTTPRAAFFEDEPAGRLAPPRRTSRSPSAPGTVIGPYQLLEQIGEGGIRPGLRRRATAPHSPHAWPSRSSSRAWTTAQIIARFEAERQALALMDHPNIAQVFDAGTTESGRPYFVMELVNGVPDHRLLRSRAAHDPRPAGACSSRSARRCSTPTARGSFIATSSPPTSWWLRTTACLCPR